MWKDECPLFYFLHHRGIRMKTYHDLKKITVDSEEFFYIIHERNEFVRLRIYSGSFKTTYFDMYFTWKDNYWINFFKPSIAERLIRYAMQRDWDFKKERQVKKIDNASFLIDQLKLTELET